MREDTEEQFSKWIPLHTCTRACERDGRCFCFSSFSPACGLILCSTFAIYRQAGQHVRENIPLLSRLMVLPA